MIDACLDIILKLKNFLSGIVKHTIKSNTVFMKLTGINVNMSYEYLIKEFKQITF